MYTLREIKEKLQMPFNKAHGSDDWLSIYIYSPLARPIVKLLLPTAVTANQVTAAMVIIGVSGCLLFTLGNYWATLLGICLIHLHIVLDHADGPIARARNATSLKGVYIERVGHDLIFSLFFFSLALGAARKGLPPVFMLVLGFCASFGCFFYKHTRRAKIYCTLVENHKSIPKTGVNPDNMPVGKIAEEASILHKLYRKTQIAWEPVAFINLTTLLAICDLVYIIPIFYGLTYPVQFVLSFIYQANMKKDWVYDWLKRL